MSAPARARLDDPDVLAEIVAATRQANTDALCDPGTLARYLDGGYNPRPHLDVISRNLAALANGECRKLMIMVPPQTGKSQLAAVWTPLWWLIRNPLHRLIIASYGQALAVNRGKSIRRLVNAHGWRWGLALAWGSRQTAEWELESGGGIKSVGFGSGVTGFPADMGIIDDPVKSRAEADSLVFRERTWEWYSADFVSRLAPGAPTIMIGTPWHHDDLLHRCLERDGDEAEGGQWRVVRLHAFAQADDAAGRAPGQPLWHPKLAIDDTAGCTAHWEDKRSSSTPRDWAALYMLNPQPLEGALVTEALLRQRRYPELPPGVEPVKAAVAVDPSGGGKDTAGVIGGFLGSDGRLYVTHDRSVTGPSEAWSKAACELAVEIDAETLITEVNFGGDVVPMAVRLAWDVLARERRADDPRWDRFPPYIHSVRAKRGKLVRAEPIAQQITSDRMRFGAYLPEVEAEWCTWRPSDTYSPGRLDASVYLAYGLLPVPGAETVISSATGIRKDAPRQGTGVRINRPRPGRRGW